MSITQSITNWFASKKGQIKIHNSYYMPSSKGPVTIPVQFPYLICKYRREEKKNVPARLRPINSVLRHKHINSYLNVYICLKGNRKERENHVHCRCCSCCCVVRSRDKSKSLWWQLTWFINTSTCKCKTTCHINVHQPVPPQHTYHWATVIKTGNARSRWATGGQQGTIQAIRGQLGMGWAVGG